MFAYAQTPTIVVVDGVVSPEECEAIIDHTKDKLERSTVASEGGHEEDSARTSTGGFFPHHDFPEICSRVSDIAGIPLDRAEPMNVLRYTSDQEYKPHYDTLGEELWYADDLKNRPETWLFSNNKSNPHFINFEYSLGQYENSARMTLELLDPEENFLNYITKYLKSVW